MSLNSNSVILKANRSILSLDLILKKRAEKIKRYYKNNDIKKQRFTKNY